MEDDELGRETACEREGGREGERLREREGERLREREGETMREGGRDRTRGRERLHERERERAHKRGMSICPRMPIVGSEMKGRDHERESLRERPGQEEAAELGERERERERPQGETTKGDHEMGPDTAA